MYNYKTFMKKVLSVDLESFLHRDLNKKTRTKNDNGFTLKTTKYLLDLFDKYNTKATFFVLGEVYDWYPDLINEIAKRGHEIAYHGHSHFIIEDKKTLIADLKKSEKFIKKFKPQGFRAPRMFLKRECLGVLKEYGFKYDSSLYGFKVENKKEGIKEIPASFFSYLFGVKNDYPGSMGIKLLLGGVPYGSGLMLSLFQKNIQYFINKSEKRGEVVSIFIHPWQLMDYEEGSITFLQKILYRRKVNSALEFLLKNNKFYPLKELL